MLVKEYIQRIQSLYSKGVQSDDSRLTSRHIFNKMLTVRSKLISQSVKKRQKISQWNYQTLPCVELIKVPVHDCPCLPPIGCTILRSRYQIPEPLTDLNRHILQSVTSLDGTLNYSEIKWEEAKYKKGAKYTAHHTDYFIRNKYLYTMQKGSPKVITITGLFEDPTFVETFISYCPNTELDCLSPLDREFPLDLDMTDTLVEMCINELIILFSKTQEDQTSDTKDSATAENK